MEPKQTILFIGEFPKTLIPRPEFTCIQFPVFAAKHPTSEFLEALKNVEAIVSRSGCDFSRSILEKAPRLKLLIKAGAGIDMVNLEFCRARGIEVHNTPGGNAQSVAELALGLMIGLNRHIPCVHESFQKGGWLKDSPQGEEIFGKKVSIIGYGHVGRRLAKILKAFECEIIVHDPTLSPQEIDFAKLESFKIEDCANCAVKEMDFIILCSSLTDSSQNFIDAKKISKMKPGTKIVNVSRAAVMNKEAVGQGLAQGIIGGLAIDTWWQEPMKENPFAGFSNVICTPHIGANTKEALERVTKMAVAIIQKYFAT